MNQEELFVQMALNPWKQYQQRADKLFDGLTDEQLTKEIAPGRNRGIYVLGHLTAVNDGLFDILELGERHFAHLDHAFIKSPDRAVHQMPSLAELRDSWNKVSLRLAEHFEKMSPSQWFKKHKNISAEDFLKEPHRNKLSVLISRTNHLAYHMGQLMLIK
jgi:DinB superfamily